MIFRLSPLLHLIEQTGQMEMGVGILSVESKGASKSRGGKFEITEFHQHAS